MAQGSNEETVRGLQEARGQFEDRGRGCFRSCGRSLR